jgi:hypothetical protein
MNTIQIDKLLRRCKLPLYRGVFACDRVPTHSVGFMVVNLDPHDRPGSHWIVVYIAPDRQFGEYFDSFGRPPEGRLRAYLNAYCTRWIYNRMQLQSVVSKYCGHYCIAYCVFRSRKGMDMSKFIAHFSKDTGFNDMLVRRLVSMICKRVSIL